ncbi:MAG: 3-phosphoshikimate 1-carboxyvinyltransferase [Phycisphaerae bacterium]|nr:3-phosphoshikimate 1-carboxyvinyltransferase [Phycisphaerae bacterium]OUX03158.1 MAG: 3-phosphoshikimate 1-carboxyvinyltransferase [Phycisphaeraceae bacterium TMED231]
MSSPGREATKRIPIATGAVRGTVRPPGSKSLTNRYLVLGALCRGAAVIRQPLRADDPDRLLAALETLGTIVRPEGDVLRIDGGDGRFPGGGIVDLGAGGTPVRFMLAAAGLARLPVDIDGTERMRARPIRDGVDLLRAVGGTVEFLEAPDRLPIRVLPPPELAGGAIEVGRTASSQFVSAIMLIAPFTRDGVDLRFSATPTSPTYLELTLDVLASVAASVTVDRDDHGGLRRIRIDPSPIPGFDVEIEADASSAIYPAMLAAGSPGGRIEILGLGDSSRQPDLAAIRALQDFGATVEMSADRTVVSGPSQLRGTELDCTGFPDAAVGLAVLAGLADGTTRLTGLETLRIKESDRIAALAIELRKVGCDVVEAADSIRITPAVARAEAVEPRRIGTWDDHRIAMSFAVLGTLRGGIEIEDPDCVTKSHPGFWAELDGLAG